MCQALMKWSSLPAEHATWEDFEVARARFPDAVAWDEAVTRGAGNVLPATGMTRMEDYSMGWQCRTCFRNDKDGRLSL